MNNSKQEKDMDKLILAGNEVLDKQESIKMLHEYSTFLQEIGNHEELLSFIREELIKSASLECYFGKQIYTVEDIADFYEHHKELIDRYLRKIFLSSRSETYLKFYLINKKKLMDIFNIALEVVKTNRISPIETVELWLDEAVDDIQGARRDLHAECAQESVESTTTSCRGTD